MTRPVLLITGASSGIGAAVARLAAPDHDLALHYNANRDGAEAVLADCEAAGAGAVLIQADLGTPEGPHLLFDAFDAAFSRLDKLVNNAGIVDVAASVTDFSHARVARMMAVNLTGPILVASQAVRRMQIGASMVNISSAAVKHGSPGQYVDYAASKGGLETFSKGLALEVAPKGIRVNALRPGIIETDIHAKGGQPDRVAALAPNVPMRRAGSAEEVAQAVLWLLSDGASYVTDGILDVSGGR